MAAARVRREPSLPPREKIRAFSLLLAETATGRSQPLARAGRNNTRANQIESIPKALATTKLQPIRRYQTLKTKLGNYVICLSQRRRDQRKLLSQPVASRRNKNVPPATDAADQRRCAFAQRCPPHRLNSIDARPSFYSIHTSAEGRTDPRLLSASASRVPRMIRKLCRGGASLPRKRHGLHRRRRRNHRPDMV